jgi:GGDEF domain-containing protein
MKLLVLFCSIVLLSGCSTVDCSLAERHAIEQENTRLLEKRVELEKLQKEHKVFLYDIDKFNKQVDNLKYRSNYYNRACLDIK